MIPRSYDQRIKEGVHTKGFKLTSNSIGEFGVTDGRFCTKEGNEMRQRNVDQFEKHCKEHFDDEMYRLNNKRQLLADKHEKRWAYSKNQGGELQQFVSDPNNLFMKSLMPLDKKAAQVQEDAFKRTNMTAGVFRPEVSSLIWISLIVLISVGVWRGGPYDNSALCFCD